MVTDNHIVNCSSTADDQRRDLDQGDARNYREEILQLYKRTGRADLCSQFDWYYRSEGHPPPTTCFLRDHKGQLCGIASVSVRDLRLGSTPIRAGVTGNLLIDRSKGMYYGASTLVSAMKSLVAKGQLDILLGIPNNQAYPVFARLGFREIDRWSTHALLYHSRRLLQPRFGIAGMLASFVVDSAAVTCRAIGKHISTSASGVTIRPIGEEELADLPVERWRAPDSVISMPASVDYLISRYLRCPSQTYSIVAIINGHNRICGCLCVRRSPRRSWIIDCFVDRTQISEANAVLAFCNAWKPSDYTVWIPHLRSSEISRQLSGAGLIRVSSVFGGYPDYPLIGFWQPKHPLSTVFSQPSSWDILPGFNDI